MSVLTTVAPVVELVVFRYQVTIMVTPTGVPEPSWQVLYLKSTVEGVSLIQYFARCAIEDCSLGTYIFVACARLVKEHSNAMSTEVSSLFFIVINVLM